MTKHISKFIGINYPLFALKKKPFKLVYSIDSIYAIKSEGNILETVDNKNLSGDYFSRLLQMVNRINFDYTCKNLQDVIYSKPQWGIDSTAQPVDLSRREPVKAKTLKVRKVKNNLIWLDSISYPFKLSTNERIILTDAVYAVVVNINNEWYITSFTDEKQTVDRLVYI